MSVQLIKIAVVYLFVGVLLGYYMSIVHDYELTGVHVHINLLGWVALTLIGLLYHSFPALASNGLAKTHFWLHNIGLPVMMISLFLFFVTDNDAWITGVAAGSTVTIIGLLAFMVNIFKNLKA